MKSLNEIVACQNKWECFSPEFTQSYQKNYTANNVFWIFIQEF